MEHNENQELNCDENGVCETDSQNNIEEQAPPASATGKMIYFGDPMCSWCWGIANHLEKLKEAYKDQLQFVLVLGGLRPGGGDPWNDRMKGFLRKHWVHVQEASGQPFSFDLLDREHFHYDTEPPSRAVRIVRDLNPEKEWAFFKAVQRKFYVGNEDPGDHGFYQSICQELDIPFDGLKALFETERYKTLVREDFAFSRELGISGFPSVVVQMGEKYAAISMGYSDYETMNARISTLMASA